MLRKFHVSDDGDEVQVALVQNGKQVGNIIFDDDVYGSAFDQAFQLATAWVASAPVVA